MKITIGRKDRADFPELLLTDIHVKIDTGAYTSSIHSHQIKEVTIKGEKYIKFELLDPAHPAYNKKNFKTKNYKKKRVKNSFGKSEQRFVVETLVVLFGSVYPIELSLSERSDMKYPILIGRKLLKGRFVVDTARYNLSYRLKQKTGRKKQTSKIESK